MTRLKINDNSRPPDDIPPYGNFEYDLIRSADDFEAMPLTGKGAAYCYTHSADSIIVWSTGGPPIAAPSPALVALGDSPGRPVETTAPVVDIAAAP